MKTPLRTFSRIEARGDFFDGGFRIAKDPDFHFEGKSPANKKDVIISPACSYSAGEEAIASAMRARDAWAATDQRERASLIKKLRLRIEAAGSDLGDLISREIGKPRWESAWEISISLGRIDSCLQESASEEEILKAGSRIREKPRGVALILSHYNQPLESPLGYLIPALLSGNVVVYKPNKKAPGVGQKLAECFLEAGFPAGVFNMVQGGREMARRLAQNEHIDVIFYAGDYEFGKHLRKDTFDHNEKLLLLETGGKNPLIVWEDADLEAALREALIASYLTTGQRAESTSRLILHEPIASEFMDKFHERAKKIEIGNPFAEATPAFMGPLVDKKNLDRYLTFQGIALREKAECIMRGKALSIEGDGFFVSPSIYLFKERDPKKILASVYLQTEIFGPSLGIHTVSTLEEAAVIANASHYGLVASVFTRREENFRELWKRLRYGGIHWNAGTLHREPLTPSAGLRRSRKASPIVKSFNSYMNHAVLSIECEQPGAYFPDSPPGLGS